MRFSFTATIYKVGINPCVPVPAEITMKMKATKGYIPVKGKIKDHSFTQTLVPIKNEAYRLYVNGIMLKGSGTNVGDTVKFTIEQDKDPQTAYNIEMPKQLKKELDKNKLQPAFRQMTAYRQKEILRYLNQLKTEEALLRNISKLISGLKKKTA